MLEPDNHEVNDSMRELAMEENDTVSAPELTEVNYCPCTCKHAILYHYRLYEKPMLQQTTKFLFTNNLRRRYVHYC